MSRKETGYWRAYNRRVRIASLLTLFLALAACNRGTQSNDAVRQGVLDYLGSRPNLSMGGMNVDVTKVDFNGNQAIATVSFTPKTGPAGNGMRMCYTLEQKSGKWTVVGKADSGGSPHGGAAAGQAMPGMANPHGGAMGGAPGGMPGGIDTEKPAGGARPETGKK
jgi:hypothetical protein